MQIDVQRVIHNRFPSFQSRHQAIQKGSIYALRRLIRESEINNFMAQHQHAKGMEFVESVLDHFNLSYRVSDRSRRNIPATGRVVIVANHPLGALDGLTLLKMVGDVRKDVKILANNLLSNISNLEPLLLPVNNLSGRTSRKEIQAVHDALQREEAVIIFPAGEVSRAKFGMVRDGDWHSSFLGFARKSGAPVLPVRVKAKNSPLFYQISRINKPLSALMLPREMFKQQSRELPIHVGEALPISQIDSLPMNNKQKAQLVRKHLYRLGKNRAPLIKGERSVDHPQSRKELKRELKSAEKLGETADGQRIYLVDYCADSALIREIGRLREITFRAVGEGTGQRRDIDRYDRHYRHLVLWDEENLELVGAYRIGEAWRTQGDISQLYSASLFQYEGAMTPYITEGIELGRSFVQPAYWGKRSLDYLWYGIGAYLKHHPQVRYMFGPVSLSMNLPPLARALIVWYYNQYYSSTERLAVANAPFRISADEEKLANTLFIGTDPKEDFEVLKSQLKQMGSAVPTLYKQYAEVTDEGGSAFIDFGIDPDFGYCVDGLILVDTQRLKPKKIARYIGPESH